MAQPENTGWPLFYETDLSGTPTIVLYVALILKDYGATGF